MAAPYTFLGGLPGAERESEGIKGLTHMIGTLLLSCGV